MSIKRKILLLFVPFLIVCVIRFLLATCRIRLNISKEVLDLFKGNRGFIFAFWHGELLLQPTVFERFIFNKKAFVLSSKHFDGEIISRSMSYFGLDTLRGSTNRGGSLALLQIIRELKNGNIIAITPDGPRGPYHSIANGIVIASQKSDAKIVVSRISYSNCWTLASWDRFKIPKPFSRVTFHIQTLLSLDKMSLDESKAFLKEKMECESYI